VSSRIARFEVWPGRVGEPAKDAAPRSSRSSSEPSTEKPQIEETLRGRAGYFRVEVVLPEIAERGER